MAINDRYNPPSPVAVLAEKPKRLRIMSTGIRSLDVKVLTPEGEDITACLTGLTITIGANDLNRVTLNAIPESIDVEAEVLG